MPSAWSCSADREGAAVAVGRKTSIRAARVGLALSLGLGLYAAPGIVGAPAAQAVGHVIIAGTPLHSGADSVAVSSTGDALVAWSNTTDISNGPDFVQYCVVPVGATACSHNGDLTPADGAVAVDNVQAIAYGSTYVILADVYGAQGTMAADYMPEQEWQSTDGGATWSIVDGGLSVTDGITSADTGPLNAVIVPGTGVLGYAWDSPGSGATFNAFPLSSPPECSKAMCGQSFAQLEPSSNPDQVGNSGGQVASEAGSQPGVLGVFPTLFTNGPFACPSSHPDGLVFAYAAGNQSASNNFNISPGNAGSAWKVPDTLGICSAQYPAVGGGPGGFGVLFADESHNTVDYRPFDSTNKTFNDTTNVVLAQGSEQQGSVSQDATGGVYVTYIDSNNLAINLAYSYDGGATWSGPNVLNTNPDYSGDLHSAVNGAGQGWAVWFDQVTGTVDAQPFTAADSIPPSKPTTLSTSQKSGATTGSSITVPFGTTGEDDHATLSGGNVKYAGGTVAYTLYSAPSCATASKVYTDTVSVTGGVVPASKPVTATLALGTYYWKADFSGNPGTIKGVRGNLASSTSCGDEVLTVGSTAAVSSGGSTNDHSVTLTISCGIVPCTITITVTIDPPASTTKLATGKVRITRKGRHSIIVPLTAAGKTYFKTHHSRVKTFVKMREVVHSHTATVKKTVTLTYRKKR
jgi:hypothetical protein